LPARRRWRILNMAATALMPSAHARTAYCW
jgi:hypothetical protein